MPAGARTPCSHGRRRHALRCGGYFFRQLLVEPRDRDAIPLARRGHASRSRSCQRHRRRLSRECLLRRLWQLRRLRAQAGDSCNSCQSCMTTGNGGAWLDSLRARRVAARRRACTHECLLMVPRVRAVGGTALSHGRRHHPGNRMRLTHRCQPHGVRAMRHATRRYPDSARPAHAATGQSGAF